MPQALSAVYVHLVFSTKERRPYFRKAEDRDALHSFLGRASKELDCATILVGGVEDHVHILARLGRTITQADWVKELKRVSNKWLKERGPDYADFEWQGGYAIFAVSASNLEPVKKYIAGQEEHHRKTSFQDEVRALLRKHGVEWDERLTQPLRGWVRMSRTTQGSPLARSTLGFETEPLRGSRSRHALGLYNSSFKSGVNLVS